MDWLQFFLLLLKVTLIAYCKHLHDTTEYNHQLIQGLVSLILMISNYVPKPSQPNDAVKILSTCMGAMWMWMGENRLRLNLLTLNDCRCLDPSDLKWFKFWFCLGLHSPLQNWYAIFSH